MRSALLRKVLGYGLFGIALCALVVCLLWSSSGLITEKSVVNRQPGAAIVVDSIKTEKPVAFVKGYIESETSYFADVRTHNGDIVRVAAGKNPPTVGQRVNIEILEYADGSTEARATGSGPW